MQNIPNLLLLIRTWLCVQAIVAFELVYDISLGPNSSLPHSFCSLKGSESHNRVLFVVDDGLHGEEPWVVERKSSNGRLVASLLKDLSPGRNSTEVVTCHPLAQGNVVFVARIHHRPLQLWMTDGTARGTRLVHRFASDRVQPPSFTIFRDDLYFPEGPELWKLQLVNDSYTPVLIRDMTDLMETDESISTLYVWDDILYLSGDGTTGLFRTDGSTEKLQLVEPGISVAFQQRHPELDGKLYFVTTDRELWFTGGTKHNTQPVALEKLKYAQVVDLFPYSIGGKIVFGMGDPQKPHLFATDGTENGTLPLYVALQDGFVFDVNIFPSPELYLNFPDDGGMYYFTGPVTSSHVARVSNGALAFIVDSAGPLTLGFSIWTTNGESAEVLHEFFDTVLYDTLDLQDGRLLVRTTQPDEIWITDGTFQGTSTLYRGGDHSVYNFHQTWSGSYWALMNEQQLVFAGHGGDSTGVEILVLEIPPPQVEPEFSAAVTQEVEATFQAAACPMSTAYFGIAMLLSIMVSLL